MDNLNNHQTNHPNSQLRNNGKVNTHIQTLDTESTPAPYTEGYIHGRAAERSLENRSVDVQEKTTAARGLLLGVALTSLVGLTLGTVFFLNQQHEEPVPSIIVPSRQPSPEPQKETTIIERTTETIQQPPASPVEVQPEINLTVPNGQQPTAPTQQNTTPRSAPTQTQPQNQTSPTNPTTTQQNRTPQSSQSAPTSSPTIRQPSFIEPTSSPSTQNQNSTGTTTPTQPNNTNVTSPAPTQNQTQPNQQR